MWKANKEHESKTFSLKNSNLYEKIMQLMLFKPNLYELKIELFQISVQEQIRRKANKNDSTTLLLLELHEPLTPFKRSKIIRKIKRSKIIRKIKSYCRFIRF